MFSPIFLNTVLINYHLISFYFWALFKTLILIFEIPEHYQKGHFTS